MVSSSFNILSTLSRLLTVLALLRLTESASSSSTQTDMSELLVDGQHDIGKLEIASRLIPLNLNPKEIDEVGNTGLAAGRKLGMMVIKEEAGYLNVRPQKMRNSSHRRHVKVKRDGRNFIPFNADYHVPKPHPPKNN